MHLDHHIFFGSYRNVALLFKQDLRRTNGGTLDQGALKNTGKRNATKYVNGDLETRIKKEGHFKLASIKERSGLADPLY